MFAAIISFLIGIAVLGLVLTKSFVRVPRDFNFVVHTLGKFDRVLEPGIHLVVPFLSRIRAKVTTLDQLLEVRPTAASVGDGSTVSVEGTVRYTVKDTARAYTAVADHRAALAALATSEWQRALAVASPPEALTAAQHAVGAIREKAREWGLEVLNAVPLLNLDDVTVMSSPAAPGHAGDERG